jgi:predicted DNA binding CopG/RHH family protein
MERKAIKKKDIASIAEKIASDGEQSLWENKKLGFENKYAKRSSLYKAPAKLISIRIPDEVLEVLKVLAEKEGLRYQTYVVSLLKKHARQRKAG